MKRSATTAAVIVTLMSAAAGTAAADSSATGTITDSPGVLTAIARQVPVHVPVNRCAVTANVVGLLNPGFGATCQNH
ncbi:chaplin [Streptomyces aureocirculatus]|uniref:chaplin n=1 Tax=Streptomyces aureocirculatus TaxID=67275 RepID=UPI0004C926AD|nr:chaplin [Streptomyces aureocirculatus]